MRFEDYAYPEYGTRLVEAYAGRFEAVFILLHPFVRVPEELSWKTTREYPDDCRTVAAGTKCRWAEIATATGLTSSARLNQALLTSIGSLTGDLADPSGRHVLANFLESQPIWMPTEGRFELLLQPDLLRIFAESGAEELLFVPEFPNSDPVVRLALEGLSDGSIPFPTCGTLLAPDASFLFTVDWDSLFTLFYGPRSFIADAARGLRLEGFFATPNTDHAWWNYSLGCATVTVSPEDWQTA